MNKKQDAQILTQFLAGVSLEYIRDAFGLRSVTQVEAAVRRALETDQKRAAKFPQSAVEVARIDAMYKRMHKLALGGDVKAVESCLKMSEKRAALVDEGYVSELTEAYDESIAALDLKPEDKAVVENGRAIAKQMDWTLRHGTSYERTKALYLMPHLMNVLRELGASPSARGEIVQTGKEMRPLVAEKNPLEELQAQMKKRMA